MDGGAVYWKGMDQSGEENLESTRHKIKIALNERESERQLNKKQFFFSSHLQATNENCLCFNKNTFSQCLGTGFLLLN